jgi:cytochrome P450
MHEKYGPVVRISPDELAFASSRAWRDIYGLRAGDRKDLRELPKWRTFYKHWPTQPDSILFSTTEMHSALRRQLSPGFSDKSLREQEPLISGYIDLLMSRLRARCGSGPIEVSKFYNWVAFDIIGHLAFGEPFGCLDSADYHPWVANVFKAPKEISRCFSVRILGFEYLAFLMRIISARNSIKHIVASREKLIRRIETGVGYPDLLEGLLKNQEKQVGIDKSPGNPMHPKNSDSILFIEAGGTHAYS